MKLIAEGIAGVYPRTCGGAIKIMAKSAESEGLSPHVRGSHISQLYGDDLQGSIPARAGEPLAAKALNKQ